MKLGAGSARRRLTPETMWMATVVTYAWLTQTTSTPPKLTGEDSNLSLHSFFFQAEDGIRDLYVTGVQTCALPISQRRQSVLFEAGHLAESAVETIGQEHRIITETGAAARRPDQRSVHARLDFRDMIVGPGHAERGDEMRLALVGCCRAAFLQQPLDPRHRRVEILARSGPARGKQPRRAIQRIDHEPLIVGKSGELDGHRRRDRLDPGI